jgi:hypothetical protein
MEHSFHINDLSNPKAKAFLEYIKTLDFVSMDDDIQIPQWQKDAVRERIENTKTEDCTSWEEARKQLTFKRK